LTVFYPQILLFQSTCQQHQSHNALRIFTVQEYLEFFDNIFNLAFASLLLATQAVDKFYNRRRIG